LPRVLCYSLIDRFQLYHYMVETGGQANAQS